MSTDGSFITVVREIVRVVKTGGGILGKSAILVGLLIVLFIVAIFRLHDDRSILWALGGIAILFLIWYGPILWLVNRFPEKAFLDGPQWVEHQVMLAAKGQPAILASTLDPSSGSLIPNPAQAEENNLEQKRDAQ